MNKAVKWKIPFFWDLALLQGVVRSKSFEAMGEIHLQSSKGLLGHLDLRIRGQSYVLKCLDPINPYPANMENTVISYECQQMADGI